MCQVLWLVLVDEIQVKTGQALTESIIVYRKKLATDTTYSKYIVKYNSCHERVKCYSSLKENADLFGVCRMISWCMQLTHKC